MHFHGDFSCMLPAVQLILYHPCRKAAVLLGRLSAFCGREVSWIVSIFVLHFWWSSIGGYGAAKCFSELVSILIALLHFPLRLLSLCVYFLFILVESVFIPPTSFTIIVDVLCVFLPAKSGSSAAFGSVILDLKGKTYWLVFSLLFGIVHVQLASADVFWKELVTFKTLQMSAVLKVSALLWAAPHKTRLSCEIWLHSLLS